MPAYRPPAGESGGVPFTVQLDLVKDNDQSATGLCMNFLAGEVLAFGDVCIINSIGRAVKADANATPNKAGYLMACSSAQIGAESMFLLKGVARNDAWEGDNGAILYLSKAPGEIVQTTPPTDPDDMIQILGVQIADGLYYFDPQLNYMTHV